MNIIVSELANQLQMTRPVLYRQAVVKKDVFSALAIIHLIEYNSFMRNHHEFSKRTQFGRRLNQMRVSRFYRIYGHQLAYAMTRELLTKDVYNTSREYAKRYMTDKERYEQLNGRLTATV